MPDQSFLPSSPPPIHQRLVVTDQQLEQARRILTTLAETLEGLPVVLCQDGDLLSYAGTANEELVERITRISSRIWNEGATRIAREWVRFAEETIGDDSSGRANFMIYSAHIEAAVTLSIGWETAVSLTQIRAEVIDIRQKLQAVFTG